MGNFFQSTTWIIISAVISILGLSGTGLGIYQYFKNSKELREYKYLFKVAGQHVDLEDKKSQIDDYDKQIADMQKTIKEKIPKEAQKIALRGILDNEIQVLSASYTKVKTLQSELESLKLDDLPDDAELIKNVNKIIEPSYSQKRLNNLFSTLFYLVSIISSFLSMILPHTMYRMVSQIILLFQLIVGIRLTTSVIKANYTKEELTDIGYKICSIMPTVFMGLSIIPIFLIVGLNHINEDVVLGMALIFFIAHIIFGIMHFYPKGQGCRNKKLFGFWVFLSAICVGTMIAFLFIFEEVFFIISVCACIINEIFWGICSFRFVISKK